MNYQREKIFQNVILNHNIKIALVNNLRECLFTAKLEVKNSIKPNKPTRKSMNSNKSVKKFILPKISKENQTKTLIKNDVIEPQKFLKKKNILKKNDLECTKEIKNEEINIFILQKGLSD